MYLYYQRNKLSGSKYPKDVIFSFDWLTWLICCRCVHQAPAHSGPNTVVVATPSILHTFPRSGFTLLCTSHHERNRWDMDGAQHDRARTVPCSTKCNRPSQRAGWKLNGVLQVTLSHLGNSGSEIHLQFLAFVCLRKHLKRFNNQGSSGT